jgi:hypothetical protein
MNLDGLANPKIGSTIFKLREIELFAGKKNQTQKTQLRLIDASPDQVCWIVSPIDGKANPSWFCEEIPPFKYFCFPTATCFGRGRKAGTRVGHPIPVRVDYKSQRA